MLLSLLCASRKYCISGGCDGAIKNASIVYRRARIIGKISIEHLINYRTLLKTIMHLSEHRINTEGEKLIFHIKEIKLKNGESRDFL